MKNQNTNENAVEIVALLLVERISKNGNNYKCIVAIDENDKEHFVCFAK